MVILGAASGFIGGMLIHLLLCRAICGGLLLFSGWGLRSIIYIFILLAAITTVMIYARKVKQDMSKSIVYELEQAEGQSTATMDTPRFTKRQKVGLLLIVAAIILNVFGIFNYGWSFNEMSANFLLAGLLAGVIGGLGINGTFEAMIEGMKDILFGAMIVGFAKGIIVILEDGQVIDTSPWYDYLAYRCPSSAVIIAMFILQFF